MQAIVLLIVIAFLMWYFIPPQEAAKGLVNKVKNTMIPLDKVLQKTRYAYSLKRNRKFEQCVDGICFPGFPLRIRIVELSEGVCFVITVRLKLPHSISIGKETASSRFKKKLGIDDFQVGDTEFDELMLLKGAYPENFLLIFDEVTRDLLKNMVANSQQFSISKSLFKVSILRDDYNDKNKLRQIVDDVLAICKKINKLTDHKNFANVILKNVISEKNPEVKIKMLQMYGLFNRPSDVSVQRKMLTILEANWGPKVKIAAARFIPGEGEAYLLHVLEKQDKELQLQALDTLQYRSSSSTLQSLLQFLHKIPKTDKELHAKLQNVIQIIQDRENITELKGSVSITEPDETAGALSEAVQNSDGMISIIEDEKKQQQF